MRLPNLIKPVRDIPSPWVRRLVLAFWAVLLPPLLVVMSILATLKDLGSALKTLAYWYTDDLPTMWAKEWTP
ncbi:hypothetical protein FIU82_06040 [Pseudoalteromonas sp. THAF3]|uniref:hypothetical protein n=1 Tax=Pseudoalteromonas sp. THAF3 TaxID=2587843 RepID=UPI001269344A|nr:hypothetical protein [Pseudoalteromonas sp. THAF3]QFU04576.1 hypothetical protein FIU82_06040 [Pseudoalteromonas sp. THAF3]